MSLAALFGAKEVKVRAGEPLKLALGISGSPTPTVTWSKNGKPVERVSCHHGYHSFVAYIIALVEVFKIVPKYRIFWSTVQRKSAPKFLFKEN